MSSNPLPVILLLIACMAAIALACSAPDQEAAPSHHFHSEPVEQARIADVHFGQVQWPTNGGTATIRVENTGTEPVQFEWEVSVHVTRPSGIPAEVPPPQVMLPATSNESDDPVTAVSKLAPGEVGHLYFEVDPTHANATSFYLHFNLHELDYSAARPTWGTGRLDGRLKMSAATHIAK